MQTLSEHLSEHPDNHDAFQSHSEHPELHAFKHHALKSVFIPKPAAMGLAGAAAGGLMYGFCKSKCPGSTGGILANLPGAGLISGVGNMFGGGNKEKVAEKDAEIEKLKAELAAAKTGEKGEGEGEEGEGGEGAEGNKEEEEAKKLAQEKEEKLHAELLKGENSACRLNCKIKSLMAAAAAAGAVSLKMGAGPIDEWTVGPVLAAMEAQGTKQRRARHPKSYASPPLPPNHSQFLGFDRLQPTLFLEEAAMWEVSLKALPEKAVNGDENASDRSHSITSGTTQATSMPGVAEWQEFLTVPVAASS